MAGPLITVAGLRARLGDPELRVADTRWYLGEPGRGSVAYAESHVPGAVHVDLEQHLSAPAGPGRHPHPDPVDFATVMAKLGIGAEHLVVAYDDRGGAVAARLWWMLRAQGHDRALVLDGGLTAWRAAEQPETAAAPGSTPPTQWIAAAPWPGTLDRHEVRSRLGDLTLIDARSPDRYRGDTEPVDPVAGHIPSAINLDHAENLAPDQRFLPPDELRSRFEAAGVTGDAEVVSYCGSGVTACHNLLAMEVAGIPGASLYPGSWSDWSTAGEAAATGP